MLFLNSKHVSLSIPSELRNLSKCRFQIMLFIYIYRWQNENILGEKLFKSISCANAYSNLNVPSELIALSNMFQIVMDTKHNNEAQETHLKWQYQWSKSLKVIKATIMWSDYSTCLFWSSQLLYILSFCNLSDMKDFKSLLINFNSNIRRSTIILNKVRNVITQPINFQ